MQEFLNEHWLDILTTVLGLIYIWLEYRASIALWVLGIIMPALDIWLYWSHGLYGDAGMACYYTLAAVYGYAVWKFGRKKNQTTSVMPITHTPARLYLPIVVFFFVAWGLTYYVLITWTNSTVPVLDSFTNALSFVGLWAGIPFKAGLYGLYVLIAVMGYYKWKRLMQDEKVSAHTEDQ